MQVFLTLSFDQRAVAAEARAAEEAGYAGVAAGEHLFFHGPHPNGFVALAAAAGATSRIRLLTSLTVLPLYPAALAAKLATTLDQVSGGRFDMGVGVGGEYPPEFVAAGVEVTQRGARTDEALELMRALWTGESMDFDGPFTRVPELGLAPGPVQPGGRPIWLGGRSPAAIAQAGRFGDVWMPYMYTRWPRAWLRCGRRPRHPVATRAMCAGRCSAGTAWTRTPQWPGRRSSRGSARSISRTSRGSPTGTSCTATLGGSSPVRASTPRPEPTR